MSACAWTPILTTGIMEFQLAFSNLYKSLEKENLRENTQKGPAWGWKYYNEDMKFTCYLNFLMGVGSKFGAFSLVPQLIIWYFNGDIYIF